MYEHSGSQNNCVIIKKMNRVHWYSCKYVGYVKIWNPLYIFIEHYYEFLKHSGDGRREIPTKVNILVVIQFRLTNCCWARQEFCAWKSSVTITFHTFNGITMPDHVGIIIIFTSNVCIWYSTPNQYKHSVHRRVILGKTALEFEYRELELALRRQGDFVSGRCSCLGILKYLKIA